MFAASEMRDNPCEITRQKGSVKTLTFTPNNLRAISPTINSGQPGTTYTRYTHHVARVNPINSNPNESSAKSFATVISNSSALNELAFQEFAYHCWSRLRSFWPDKSAAKRARSLWFLLTGLF